MEDFAEAIGAGVDPHDAGEEMRRAEDKRLDYICGTYRSVAAINKRLRNAAENYHLIAPSSTCSSLAEGLGVLFSVVHIGLDEFYELEDGQVGFRRPVLERIASAAGVSERPNESGRLDACVHPHFCRYRVTIDVRGFDGRPLITSDEKEIDLREGSSRVKGVYQRFVDLARENHVTGGSTSQDSAARRESMAAARFEAERLVRRHRENILATCLTQARLRAIRTVGVAGAYAPEDIKPFVVARVVFTGKSRDPETNRRFAEMTADSFLRSREVLYGQRPIEEC